ncbi:MAG: acetyl-CoA decarbonylase/synthase complex subunit delta [Candidatus Brocadiia bacterium]
MQISRLTEKWSGKVNEVTLGAASAKPVTIGGQTTMPFMFEDGDMPRRPVIAMEVLDRIPDDWNPILKDAFKDVSGDTAKWARKCQDEYKADMVCLRLLGGHPENGNKPVSDIVNTVKAVRAAINIPLIIWGCGNVDKDNQIFPAVSQALAGSRCLMGTATKDNYKVLAATCLADGHNIIAESPLDINICKQVNMLLSDMEIPTDRVVIFPTTGPIGYGFEYSYSIIERTRLAALSGDKTMAYPILATLANEVWKTKETKAPESDNPTWGKQKERAVAWESMTAAGFLLAGADILVMYHPEAVALTRKYIDTMASR